MSPNMEAGRWTLKIGGLAAVVGSLLGMVGNLVHPITPLNDSEGVARVIADSAIWAPAHIAIVIGIVLMVGGLVAIRHSLREGPAGEFARFGLVAAVIGATVGLVLVTLDGVAARQLAQEWRAAAPEARDLALGLVHANETINFALASLFNLVFASVTFVLFGLAVAVSDRYPRWLGWVAVSAGTLSMVAGLIQASTGEPSYASRLLTVIGPTLITLWLLNMGVLLMRMTRLPQSLPAMDSHARDAA